MKLTHTALLEEARAARKKSALADKAVKKMVSLRRGAFYKPQEGETDGDADSFRENWYHRWITYVVPQLASGIPRVVFDDASDPDYSTDSKDLETICNQWSSEHELQAAMSDGPATDMQYDYGVGYVDVRPVPYDKLAWEPHWVRLPKGRYFEDALAMGREEVRIQGHSFAITREEATKEAGWDQGVVESYSTEAHLALLGREEDVDPPKRGEMVFHEVWVKDAKPTKEELKAWGVKEEKGRGWSSGWIFTLCAIDEDGGSSGTGMEELQNAKLKEVEFDFPRKPRQFYGSPRGPYVLFGAYTSTNASLPVGPLQACEAQIRASNIDSDVVARMARGYKRGIGLPATAGEDAVSIIRDGEHDGVFQFEGMVSKDEILQYEVGGITDQVMGHLSESNLKVEENLGLSEMHSGGASPSKNSATRDAIADSAAMIRFSGIEQGFQRGMHDLFYRVAWYYWEDKRCTRLLAPKSAEALDLEPDREYRYIPAGAQGALPFEALRFRVDAYSMKRTSEATQQFRAMQSMQMWMQVLPMIMQFPQAPWDEMLEDWGDQMNIPGMGNFARKMMAAAGQGMPMMGPEQQGMPGGPAQMSPIEPGMGLTA